MVALWWFSDWLVELGSLVAKAGRLVAWFLICLGIVMFWASYCFYQIQDAEERRSRKAPEARTLDHLICFVMVVCS